MTEHDGLREGEEAPPPGVRTMALVRWVILLAVAALAALSVFGAAAAPGPSDAAEHRVRYHCPMHPQIVSDSPGECPICHMTLEPFTEERASSPPPGPGPARPAPRPSASAEPAQATQAPEGTTDLTLTFDRTQAISIRTDRVESTSAGDALRVAASVEAPERSAAEVHVRTPGFVETILVRDVGERVKAGQTLATIYSPEVYQAEQELLSVLDWKAVPGSGKPPVDEARRRLELLSVPRAVIDRIVEKREAVRAFAVASPIDGFVVKKSAVLGAYATPETSLFDVVGLDRVYVVASVDPALLAAVGPGTAARFSTPSVPGKVFETKVDLVYPTMDPVARSARVRLSVKNGDSALRPGQVGTVSLAAQARAELTVPLDAVVQTGRSAYVFVVTGEGRYSPRVVEVGDERGERVVVHGPLQAGDRVVSRATFLVDSDSRIRASFSNLGKASP